MSIRLAVGDVAPAFSLPDQSGKTVSLADFRGKPVILYFYPAAGTPGCTTQACDFRDSLGSLAAAGYAVVGLSKDDVPAIAKFHATEGLTFPLLADPERTVHEAYGAWGEKSLYGKIVTGSLRSTFVLDEQGVITHTFYNTKATGHVAMLRKKLGIDAA